MKLPLLFTVFTLTFLFPLHSQVAPLAKSDEEEEARNENEAPELTEAADVAIEKGLQHLIKTQRKDGSWAADNGTVSIGGTSLGLMAFMVKGHFPGFGPYGPALDRAKDYLLQLAKESPNGVMGSMYEHGLFTLAMSEI